MAISVLIRRFCMAVTAFALLVGVPFTYGQEPLGQWQSSVTTNHQKPEDPSGAPEPSRYVGKLPAGKVWLQPWSSPPGSRRIGTAPREVEAPQLLAIPTDPPQVVFEGSASQRSVPSSQISETSIPNVSVVEMQIETATSRPTIVKEKNVTPLSTITPSVADVSAPPFAVSVARKTPETKPVNDTIIDELPIPKVSQLNESLGLQTTKDSNQKSSSIVDRAIQPVEFTETKPPALLAPHVEKQPIEVPQPRLDTGFIAPPLYSSRAQATASGSSNIAELPIPSAPPSTKTEQVAHALPEMPLPISERSVEYQNIQISGPEVLSDPYFQDEFGCEHEFCGDVCEFETFEGCDSRGGCQESGFYLPMEIADGPVVFIAPYLNFSFKGGDREIGEADLFLPIFQDSYEVLFLDARIRGDDDGAVEGNFGLAYRWYLDHGWIMGLYGYYDVLHSENDNTFSQGTIGAELLTLNWDFRVNGYIAESDGKGTNVAGLRANGTIVNNNLVERAYSGFDAEIGKRLAYWGMNDRFEIRGFVGGYSFNNDAAGFDSFGGLKTRLEFRIYDLKLFGPQSRLIMGAETSSDDVRDEQVFGFVHLQIPLGSREVLTPLRRRFADRPARYVD